MSTKNELFQFHGNRRVQTTPNGGEFFGIRFHETHDDMQYGGPVCVYRYCVPGRCELYAFSRKKNSLVYWSENETPIGDSLATLAVDIDTPDVRDMILDAIEQREHYRFALELVNLLLPMIAPHSETLRLCRVAMKRLTNEHHQRMKAKDAARTVYDQMMTQGGDPK